MESPVYFSAAIMSSYLKSHWEEVGAELDGSGTQVFVSLLASVVTGTNPGKGWAGNPLLYVERKRERTNLIFGLRTYFFSCPRLRIQAVILEYFLQACELSN